MLSLNWAEFDGFHRAALLEYLDLLAQAIAPEQILCLHVLGRSSVRLWTDDPARYAMRSFMDPLPDPEAAWAKFLDFDDRIACILLQECEAHHIPVLLRSENEGVSETTDRIVQMIT